MSKSKIFLFAVALIALALIVFVVISEQNDTETYIQNVETERKQRNQFFKFSAESPIAKRDSFQGLQYFPVNPDWRIKARVEYIKGGKPIAIAMTKSEPQPYIPYAYAYFKYANKEYKLMLLHKTGDKFLFLPFFDASNGKETYKGGRYINNVAFPKGETIILDFNYATNPYCVYNDDYTCPIPPKENRLDFPVLAGEKMYTPKFADK
ncbi:MAG: DUF1684 domain-containing protein [Raineya sp.]|nr:DUF1684 domain-containing protein [Raineya sp.]MDW8295486.1 DUF1684 domain-containing protein [Raineya sp.]